ncbi:MAG: lipoate--protein ligase family protein [Anaerolineae bacterium]|jgi:lipoyl(octanoyl) transferase|nr:lipoate--protein ligase family protein [Anaerolineae bacterium]MBT7075985.1 lipoate--protein ligase family protein [Anaerolineae bacterium]MBT7783740.1 lipoate--protein ligase family protein [Anaerolineae bacterium]
MKEVWRLYISPPSTGAWNMAVDEAILENIVSGVSHPTLRLYAWNPPCLSLGRSQPYTDIDAASLKKQGWDVVRRPTGGRAILHTDELTYSIIAQNDNQHFQGSILESYQHLAKMLLAALKDLGAAVEMKKEKRKESRNFNPVCFETPSAYEITVNGKKLIGSAQARQKGGILQHGSLPLIGDLTRITEVLAFPDTQERQTAAEKLLKSASTLKSALGYGVDWDRASKSFIRAFESVLGISLIPKDLSEAERSRASDLIQKKYAHPDWTERI